MAVRLGPSASVVHSHQPTLKVDFSAPRELRSILSLDTPVDRASSLLQRVQDGDIFAMDSPRKDAPDDSSSITHDGTSIDRDHRQFTINSPTSAASPREPFSDLSTSPPAASPSRIEYHTETRTQSIQSRVETAIRSGYEHRTMAELLAQESTKRLYVTPKCIEHQILPALKQQAEQRARAIAKAALKLAEDPTRWQLQEDENEPSAVASMTNDGTARSPSPDPVSPSSASSKLDSPSSGLRWFSRLIVEVLLDSRVRIGSVPSEGERAYRANEIYNLLLSSLDATHAAHTSFPADLTKHIVCPHYFKETPRKPKSVSAAPEEEGPPPHRPSTLSLYLAVLLLPIRDRNPAKNDGASPDLGEVLTLLRLWTIPRAIQSAIEIALETRLDMVRCMVGQEELSTSHQAWSFIQPILASAPVGFNIASPNRPGSRAGSRPGSPRNNCGSGGGTGRGSPGPASPKHSRQVSTNGGSGGGGRNSPRLQKKYASEPGYAQQQQQRSASPVGPDTSLVLPAAALSPAPIRAAPTPVAPASPSRPSSPSQSRSLIGQLSQLCSRQGSNCTLAWLAAPLSISHILLSADLRLFGIRDVSRYPCYDTDPAQDARMYESGLTDLMELLQLAPLLHIATQEQLEETILRCSTEERRKDEIRKFKLLREQIYKEKLKEFMVPFEQYKHQLLSCSNRSDFTSLASVIDPHSCIAPLIEPILHSRLHPQMDGWSGKERLEFLGNVFTPRVKPLIPAASTAAGEGESHGRMASGSADSNSSNSSSSASPTAPYLAPRSTTGPTSPSSTPSSSSGSASSIRASTTSESIRRSVLWCSIYGAAQYAAAYESNTPSKNRLGLDDVAVLFPAAIRLSIHRKDESQHQFSLALGEKSSVHRTPWHGTAAIRNTESKSGKGGKQLDFSSTPIAESMLSLELKIQQYVPVLIRRSTGGVAKSSCPLPPIRSVWTNLESGMQPFVWLCPSLLQRVRQEGVQVDAEIVERCTQRIF